jgi:putative endonuclease
MEKYSDVHMPASARYGTQYIGLASDLLRRAWEHWNGVPDGFTKQHHVHRLVWYETHADIMQAIKREKQLKKWEHAWKVKLISASNPTWRDLYADFTA